jgi:hypothetical protein
MLTTKRIRSSWIIASDRKVVDQASLALPSPVFILSPSPRCGTNFLSRILSLDPRFQIPNFLWEDHVLLHSGLLKEYVYRTSFRWEEESNNDKYRKRLLRHLGDGILSFLRENIDEDKQLLCKTPRAISISDFFLLFPDAKLLVLVRDGRDVTESAVKTWPNRIFAFERSAHTWATGSRLIINFMSGANSELRGHSWELVKYEDLIQNLGPTVANILRFVGIDPNTFDISRIQSMSLYGSSVHHGEKEKVHWDAVEKPKDFKPVGRWEAWSPWKKMIFPIIAGRELKALGYAGDGR